MTTATVLEPSAAAKAKVEQLKTDVQAMSRDFPQLKADAHCGVRGGWRALNEHQKKYEQKLAELRTAKIDLVKLSGTVGGDPKWTLAARAWAILVELDNAGTDIGEKGRDLIGDIEFHVPAAKLQEQQEKDVQS